MKACANNKTVLNVAMMQSCSKQGRNYMPLYKAIEFLNFGDTDEKC